MLSRVKTVFLMVDIDSAVSWGQNIKLDKRGFATETSLRTHSKITFNLGTQCPSQGET